MRSGHGAHPRGRHGRGEDAVLGNSLPPVGGEGVLRAGGKARAAVSGGGVHLVVVEGLSSNESILSSMHEILCGWPSPAPVSLIMYQAEPCACEFVATLFFEHKPKHRCTHNT